MDTSYLHIKNIALRITIVGSGYVGLVTGVCLASVGNEVICLDCDTEKVELLQSGCCPIYEPGLAEMLQENLANSRISFTDNKNTAYQRTDLIFICVGTPSKPDGSVDLSDVFEVAKDIIKSLHEHKSSDGYTTIIVKSTVPVGTTNDLKSVMRQECGGEVDFRIGNNPEFLKQGSAIHDFKCPDRVICGVENEATAELMRQIYEPFVRTGNPIYIMDIRSSEMVKYASNTFLATKISFINELAMICEHVDADITYVREGMCADGRIGNKFLFPGLGYGGSCFPKDVQAFIAMGKECSGDMQISKAVHNVNQLQRERFCTKIVDHFTGSMVGMKIAFWGVSFKPNTDDITNAPAITIMNRCVKEGATCIAFDPAASANVKSLHPELCTMATDQYEALQGAHAIVICTDWDEFKTPDFCLMKSKLADPVIFDGRNLYNPALMENEGFAYHSIGRGAVQ